jgi:membrane dipeptidase
MRNLFAVVLVCGLSAFAQTTPDAKAKPAAKKMTPAEVHRSALIVDTHADTTQRLLDEGFDMGNPPAGDQGHVDFAKAKSGNLDAEFFSIWVEPKYKGQYAKRTLQLIDAVYMQAEKHPDRMMMAFSSADILKAKKQGKLAALMGIEGGHSIENDMRLLRDFYRLGVRYMTLTWSNTNEWADSSGDLTDEKVKHHNGLTQFGREIVREMNRLGMIVDISHVSDRTFFQTLVASRAPVIASHSSARALNTHPRNMSDEMLIAMKHNGGVVMVNFFSAFIDEDFRKAYTAQAKERNAGLDAREAKWKAEHNGQEVPYHIADGWQKEWAAKIPRPKFNVLIDHIDHIAKVAGIEHVGLGSDFDGVSSLPEGIDSAADLPKITEALMKRGYSAADCHKILGGNFMRVFREVEKMRDQIKAEGDQEPLLQRKATPTK